MRRLFWLAVAGFLTVGWPPLRATETDSQVFNSYQDFATGNCRSSSLSDGGVLTRARGLQAFAEMKSDQVWKVLQETEGNYLVGTSPESRLYRVLAGGQVTEVYKFEGTHLYSLVKNRRGEVFVGVSPQGKIYRLNSKGKPTLYYDTHETYIWDLAVDAHDNLYAATGVHGKIFRITGENQGAVFYDSGEVHMRCLAFDAQGFLWAGSADAGLVYRISPSGEGRVVTSTGKQEVNHLAIAADGSVYFSANGTARRATPPAKSSGSGGGVNLPSLQLNTADASELVRALLVANSPFTASGSGREDASSNQVWRIDTGLFAQPIWGTHEPILTLDVRQNQAYVGTGSEGYLYQVNERGQATRLLRVESSALSATLFLDSDRMMLASSNPAKLYTVGDPGSSTGIYESHIIDSGLFAKWGAVQVGTDGRVSVRTRTGNTPQPDQTWNPWVAVAGNAHTSSPPARFLQFELSIASGEVNRVEVFYQCRNVAPHVSQVEILPVGMAYTAIVLPDTPPQPKTAEQLLTEASQSDVDYTTHPVKRYQPVAGHGMRTATWKATDLNGDQLRYTVSYRSVDQSQWKVLSRNLSEPVFSWDTTGWPDGRYYLQVSATDEIDNPPGEALHDETISRMFVVDNTPPAVRVVSTDHGLVRFQVKESGSGLQSVMISQDGSDYRSIAPVDGLLDQSIETFETRIEKDQMLYIRAADYAGNVGGAQAGF